MSAHVEWGHAAHTTIEVVANGATIGEYEVTNDYAIVLDSGNSVQVIEGELGELMGLASAITAFLHNRLTERS